MRFYICGAVFQENITNPENQRRNFLRVLQILWVSRTFKWRYHLYVWHLTATKAYVICAGYLVLGPTSVVLWGYVWCLGFLILVICILLPIEGINQCQMNWEEFWSWKSKPDPFAPSILTKFVCIMRIFCSFLCKYSTLFACICNCILNFKHSFWLALCNLLYKTVLM